MWKCKPNKSSPLQVILVTVFHYSSRQTGTRVGEYCCDRSDHVVLGRTVEGLWDFGLEKHLRVESSVSSCVGAREMGVLRAV